MPTYLQKVVVGKSSDCEIRASVFNQSILSFSTEHSVDVAFHELRSTVVWVCIGLNHKPTTSRQQASQKHSLFEISFVRCEEEQN
mmetsp:Transcript_6448/g.16023  ORF Transcript_6448/g.16023 Transcript_6448/m.16023 type:complete len:85 (-) Transcript_6448:544-798(-)